MTTIQEQTQLEVRCVLDECQKRLTAIIGKPVNVLYRIKVNSINPQLIINFVCHVQKVFYSDVLSRSQERHLVISRNMISWLVKWYCGYTHEQISKLVNREISNVTHSLKTVDDMMGIADPLYLGPIQEVEKLLLGVTTVDGK
jgi:chromosomal replication initiation ATPase DnaA